MNKIIIIGKIYQDPKLEYTPAATAVCTLIVETEEDFINIKKEKKTRKEWIRLVCFGNLAEKMKQDLKIGSMVYAEGKLQTRSWDELNYKKYITEVTSKDIQILTEDSFKSKSAPGPMDPAFYTTENVVWGDNEIPF